MTHEEPETKPGDPSAGEHAELRRLVRHLLQDAALADDVVQEVWLHALRKPVRLRNPRIWRLAVARRMARTLRRAERRRSAREQGVARPEAVGPGPDAAERGELLERLARAVHELDGDGPELIRLRYVEGLRVREIAARLERPEGTVKAQLGRALGTLRRRLDDGPGGRRAWALVLVGCFEWRPEDLPAARVVPAPIFGALVAGAAAWLVVGSGVGVAPPGPAGSLRPEGARPPDVLAWTAGAVRPPGPDAGARRGASGAQTRRSDALDAASAAARPARLELLVVGPDGRPEGGVRVRQSSDAGWRELGSTGADGRLELEPAPAGLATAPIAPGQPFLALQASGPGRVPSALTWFPWPPDADAPPAIELRLGGPALRVVGRVCGADGAPLAGVAVEELEPQELRALGSGGAFEQRLRRRAVTDAEGRYELDGLSPGRHQLAFDHARLAPKVLTVEGAAGEERRLEVALGDALELSGVVRHADGSPAAGAVVHAGGGPTPMFYEPKVACDREGRFALEVAAPVDATGLADWEHGRVRLWARGGEDEVAALDWRPGERAQDALELELGPARALRVLVTDGAGRPLPGRRVLVARYAADGAGQPQAPGWFEGARADERGVAELTGRFEPPLHALAFADGPGAVLVGAVRIESLDPDGAPVELACVTEPADRCVVRGRIGAPAPGMQAMLLDPRTGLSATAPVDPADGAFELTVGPPGGYELSLWWPGRGEGLLARLELEPGARRELGALEPPRPGRLALRPPADVPPELALEVLQEERRAGSPVFLEPVFSGPAAELAALELLPGSYRVVARQGRRVLRDERIELRAGEERRVELGDAR